MDRLGVFFAFVCVVAVSFVNAKSLPLPPSITPCSYYEPDISACALKRAREAWPSKFLKGDKKYRIPSLTPLEITKLSVNEGVLGLNMTASKVKVYGFEDAQIDDIQVYFKNNSVTYKVSMPRLEILLDYVISGKILILPITGSGPGNLTAKNMQLKYSYTWDLEKRKDGLTYAVPRVGVLELDMGRLYTRLENLFNGNKLLGDQMNVFMDENWRDLVKDIGPVIGEAISATIQSVLTNIFDLVSFDKAFPGYPGL